MARNRTTRRRRRGRYAFVWKLIGFLVAIAAVVTALALFFRMDHIIVTGSERYTEQEIIDASGLETGKNLYFLNKYTVKERIFESLPYVEEVAINRKLPDSLVIEVRECTAAAAVEDEAGVWLVSEHGKLLEQAKKAPAGCPLVRGETPAEPRLSGALSFGDEAEYRLGVLLTLLQEARAHGMLEGIGTIDLSDGTALNFTYLDRFTVRFPWTADVSYKLESLMTVADYLENNETGRIDLMTDGKASFIPE